MLSEESPSQPLWGGQVPGLRSRLMPCPGLAHVHAVLHHRRSSPCAGVSCNQSCPHQPSRVAVQTTLCLIYAC